MKTTLAIALPLVALVTLCAAAASKAPQGKPAQGKAPQARIERGKYLVERASMCVDCHTPHDEKGQLIQSQNLQGAMLPFRPTVPMPWGEVAPAIAGLPSLTDEQAVAFLTTGKIDRPIRPPMPPYRFTKEDAEAIVAYLRSLPPAAKAANAPAPPPTP